MIYLYLGAGLLGLPLARFARSENLRFLGRLLAFLGLIVALRNWGAW